LSQFRPLLKQASFSEAAGAVLKIGSSLKANHHREIYLAQFCERLVCPKCAKIVINIYFVIY